MKKRRTASASQVDFRLSSGSPSSCSRSCSCLRYLHTPTIERTTVPTKRQLAKERTVAQRTPRAKRVPPVKTMSRMSKGKRLRRRPHSKTGMGPVIRGATGIASTPTGRRARQKQLPRSRAAARWVKVVTAPTVRTPDTVPTGTASPIRTTTRVMGLRRGTVMVTGAGEPARDVLVTPTTSSLQASRRTQPITTTDTSATGTAVWHGRTRPTPDANPRRLGHRVHQGHRRRDRPDHRVFRRSSRPSRTRFCRSLHSPDRNLRRQRIDR